MLGAIAGDVIGSVFERSPIKTKDFPLFSEESRFTDDTVLTVAQADALLSGAPWPRVLREWARRYPQAGYGGTFRGWFMTDDQGPYGSWGNGSAMRVSPVGWAYDELEVVLEEAALSAAVTHDHPEGMKGAMATAACVFLARKGSGKDDIRNFVREIFEYDVETPLAEIRPDYAFDVSCQGSVPQSIRAFLEAEDFEDAIRNAISLGGDTDTMACIAGSIAEAHFGGVPEEIAQQAWARLDPLQCEIVRFFYEEHAPDLPLPGE